ncbi:MAG: hypothetical protein E6Q71_04260 [Pseudomonas sp.]|nr:MAG: hypothetical protein E6Q71_04260 [Pseudomonas sp.]
MIKLFFVILRFFSQGIAKLTSKIVFFCLKKLYLSKVIAAAAGVAILIFTYKVTAFLTGSNDAALIASALSGLAVFYYLLIPKFIRVALIKAITQSEKN